MTHTWLNLTKRFTMYVLWKKLVVSKMKSNYHTENKTKCRQYGNTGCGVFKRGGTKLARFLPKNQHTQRKLLNFENWISGGLRSFQKSEF